MTTQAPSPSLDHPLDRLSGPDRRRWRRLDRRAQAELDAQQLRRLRGLAGTRATVEAVAPADGGSPWVTLLDLVVGSWRLAGRVPTRASATLAAAAASGPVWLTSAGRYGPYWTLTFGGRGAPLAVLVNRLVVSRRSDGGSGGGMRRPVLQLIG